EKLAVRFGNGHIVDARFSATHQPAFVEFPKFIAITTMPLSAGVSPFVLKPNGNSVVGEGPKIFHQPVFKFSVPLAHKEASNRFSALNELTPVSPHGIFAVAHGDPLRVARIPTILRNTNFS